ncbi:MAG: HD domain-containing protein [Candidatus Fimivivens sp.]
MLYTTQTRQAMLLAYSAHHGQLDSSGVPYIFHPLHLAEQMQTESEIVAALLHDVVEDTDVRFTDLEKAGFSTQVIEAVRLLTHDKSTPYMDYINALKENPIARAVKLADLKHNSDAARLKDHTEKTRERLKKYAVALKILE